MGRTYEHISLEERCKIAELQGQGRSIRQIAAALDREPSSVSRELKRNAGSQPAGYRPAYADEQAWARRWSGAKLDRDADLRAVVLDGLSRGWSPVQVAGRLARDRGRAVISHESIYRFIYAQLRRTHDWAWRSYLPRAKSKRGRRPGKGGSPAVLIKDRVSVHQRAHEACDRRQAGHWEADFMLFAKYGQSALILHERTSRLIAIATPPNRRAEPTAARLADLLEPLPPGLRRTLTFDNGTEFASHSRLKHHLGLATFFCDPHSPWQKGGIENAIGRLRRFLPRKTDLDTLGPHDITRLARAYNHTPRQCLDFQTPAEVFSQLLHFKCESTSPPSRG